MGRGGKREGAGRPKGTGRFGEPTKPLRVPVSDFDKGYAKILRINQLFKKTPQKILSKKKLRHK